MLRIENLSFAYGDSEPLLQDVRFDFGDRGIVGIFGISGVGKTTLLKILAWLLYTPTGTVWRGDQDIMRLDKNALYAYRNKSIGFAFQDHHLLGHCTAHENIMLPFLFDDSNVDEWWIRHLTEYLSIMHLLDQKVGTISGGEKERVSIVKAMAHKPAILILDEPGDSLHVELRRKLYALIQSYAQDNIVILTSHSAELQEALQLAPIHYADAIQFYRPLSHALETPME